MKRAALPRRRPLVLRLAGWLIGPVLLLLAAWFGINATDEDLSAEARAAMTLPPPPQPSDKNGYLDYLALGAIEGAPTREVALSRLRELNDPKAGPNPFPVPQVKIDKGIPECNLARSSCLAAAAAHPQLRELIEQHAVFLRRYRAMREKPQFIELFVPASPHQSLLAYQDLYAGSRLSQLTAAIRFNAGDVAGALQELEKEDAFHRRLAAGSRMLVLKMMAYALLDRDALFVAEIARAMPRGNASIWPRLEALLNELAKEELDIVPSLRSEIALNISWMQTRGHARLPESYYDFAKDYPDLLSSGRPWWDPVAPYLYRPHQSVNLYVRRAKVGLAFAELPATEFFRQKEAADREIDSLEPGKLARAIVNPMGHNHELLGAFFPWDYIGRMHATSGIRTLARLLVKLRAAGITKHDDVVAALAGPLGRAHPDPFTGKPMQFDPRTGTIGFETKLEIKHFSGAVRPLVERYGRMALPL